MNAAELNLFFQNINYVLFTEDCESIKINPRDYTEVLTKLTFSRYEPETKITMLKLGIVGYLHGPNGELPKQISVDKAVEPGSIHGTRIYQSIK